MRSMGFVFAILIAVVSGGASIGCRNGGSANNWHGERPSGLLDRGCQ